MRGLRGFGLMIACLGLGQAAVASPALAPLGQAPGEREVQQHLPKSTAALWAVLHHSKVGEDEAHGRFTIAFSPDVKALVGRTVTLTGFMLPLDEAQNTRHFLLSKYTPVCFFC